MFRHNVSLYLIYFFHLIIYKIDLSYAFIAITWADQKILFKLQTKICVYTFTLRTQKKTYINGEATEKNHSIKNYS